MSGLCHYYITADSNSGLTYKGAFVSSAGYTGTAFWGCVLLLFRRTTLGPTIGTMSFGVAILISCIVWIRNNTFGSIALGLEGLVLCAAAWCFPAVVLDHLYALLALTCAMNALIDIRHLFGASQGYVNGEVMSTDAHQVAEYWGNDYRFWATLWLIFAFAMTGIGLFFAFDAKELKRIERNRQSGLEQATTAPSLGGQSWFPSRQQQQTTTTASAPSHDRPPPYAPQRQSTPVAVAVPVNDANASRLPTYHVQAM